MDVRDEREAEVCVCVCGQRGEWQHIRFKFIVSHHPAEARRDSQEGLGVEGK